MEAAWPRRERGGLAGSEAAWGGCEAAEAGCCPASAAATSDQPLDLCLLLSTPSALHQQVVQIGSHSGTVL
jgi:hypothetical protein